ncbi:hypothetical protein FRB95_001696 [Tulasnella sp. JGI-2019a]|nr:hypothetical protein FRB95_001696 [Tulasnella sp. JGI-2019a]
MADIDALEHAASAFPDISELGGTGGAPTGRTNFPALDGLDGMETNGFGGLDGSDDDDAGFGAFGGGGGTSTFNSGAAPVRVTARGDEDVQKFESQFPDIGQAVPSYSSPPAASAPSFYQSPPVQQQPSYGGTPYPPLGAPVFQQQVEEESEPVKAWRIKQQERIRERDEASEAKRQQTIGRAEEAIDSFYKDYNSKKEKNIAENKKSEAEYKASLTDALAAGTTWSRITELVELENSQSKTIARAGPGTTDLTRMKEVLLRLKREGDNAPGAAGY